MILDKLYIRIDIFKINLYIRAQQLAPLSLLEYQKDESLSFHFSIRLFQTIPACSVLLVFMYVFNRYFVKSCVLSIKVLREIVVINFANQLFEKFEHE